MSARENCSQIRNIYPISWVLMSWRRKEPGHQQPWYCWYARQSDPMIFQLDHHRLLHQVFRKTGDLILKTGNLLDILHIYYRLPKEFASSIFDMHECCQMLSTIIPPCLSQPLQAGKLALARSPMRVKIWPGEWKNRPGRVEFRIGYVRAYPARASAKKFLVSEPALQQESLKSSQLQWILNSIVHGRSGIYFPNYISNKFYDWWQGDIYQKRINVVVFCEYHLR